jgi:hypothetical protein
MIMIGLWLCKIYKWHMMERERRRRKGRVGKKGGKGRKEEGREGEKENFKHKEAGSGLFGGPRASGSARLHPT